MKFYLRKLLTLAVGADIFKYVRWSPSLIIRKVCIIHSIFGRVLIRRQAQWCARIGFPDARAYFSKKRIVSGINETGE